MQRKMIIKRIDINERSMFIGGTYNKEEIK